MALKSAEPLFRACNYQIHLQNYQIEIKEARTFEFLIKVCLNGTVSVILSDPPCKYGNAQFTLVPLKP